MKNTQQFVTVRYNPKRSFLAVLSLIAVVYAIVNYLPFKNGIVPIDFFYLMPCLGLPVGIFFLFSKSVELTHQKVRVMWGYGLIRQEYLIDSIDIFKETELRCWFKVQGKTIEINRDMDGFDEGVTFLRKLSQPSDHT